MEENIYIDKTVAEPTFYVGSNKDNRQLVTTIQLFSNKKDAQDWVKKDKNKYKVLSSSVRVLHKKYIKHYVLSNNKTIDITIEHPGCIMNNFVPKNKSHRVFYMNKESGLWSDAKISDEVIKNYSFTVWSEK